MNSKFNKTNLMHYKMKKMTFKFNQMNLKTNIMMLKTSNQKILIKWYKKKMK